MWWLSRVLCRRAAREWGNVQILYEAWVADALAAAGGVAMDAYVVPDTRTPKRPVSAAAVPQAGAVVSGLPQPAPQPPAGQEAALARLRPGSAQQQSAEARSPAQRPGSAAHSARHQPAKAHTPQGGAAVHHAQGGKLVARAEAMPQEIRSQETAGGGSVLTRTHHMSLLLLEAVIRNRESGYASLAMLTWFHQHGDVCFRSGGPSLCKTATSGLPGARAEQSDGFLSSGRSPQAPRHAPLPSTSGMPYNAPLWLNFLETTTYAVHVMINSALAASSTMKEPQVVASEILMARFISQQA